MRSIQTKFIVLILGCVLFSSVVIGGAGVHNAKRVVDEDSARIMNLLCEERAQKIDALLLRIEQSVETLSAYAASQLDDLDRFKSDTAYVDALTEQIQPVAVNAAENTEGALAVYVRYNPEFTYPTSGLLWSRSQLGGAFDQVEPTDFSRYGTDDSEHVGWYYIPVSTGKPLWMMPYENKNLGVRMISYVIPLYRDNVVVGVVGMDIEFSIIERVVQGASVYDTGYAFLTDQEGGVLSHRALAEGTSLPNLDEKTPSSLSEQGNDVSDGPLVAYSWRGEQKRMAVQSLRNGMKLGLTAPVSQIDAGVRVLVGQTAAALALIAVLFVVITVLMTRRIVRPLKDLNGAAKRIAEGDLSITLVRKTKDEVGTLTDSLQQTVEHLRSHIEYINSLAYRDGLTGLKNKTAYKEAVAHFDAEIRSGKPEFAVMVLDINNLKDVNDTYGHDFGDMLIVDSCKIVSNVFEHSPVYRIGGDEFAVVLERQDLARCEELLEVFKRKVDGRNAAAHPAGTMSIARGIARYEEGIDCDFSDVFKRADEAMYKNKAAMKKRATVQGPGSAVGS